MAGELAAEWIKIPDGNGNLQKVWVRDSTARRDITQLQTAVGGKADAATTLAGYGITDAYTKAQVDGMIPSVPSAYTSNPSMDGTASPGSSTGWARGDHVHPHDSTKADVSAIPTKTSELVNDSGFITSTPVTSVNGQTGAVTISVPTKTSDLTNDSGFITQSAIPSVPTASSASPAMDGTASAGSSTSWSRGDHVHPHDTSKQDVLSVAQMNAVNSGVTAAKVAEWDAIEVPTKTSELTNDSDFVTGSKFAYISGTLPAGSGTRSSYTAFPSGFNENNTILFGLSVLVNGEWRYGEGISTTNGRTFLIMNSSGVASYNTASNLFSATWKCGLMRTDI